MKITMDILLGILGELEKKAKQEGQWEDVCDMQRSRLKGLQ